MKIIRTIMVALAVSIPGLTCTSYVSTSYYQIGFEPPVERAAKQLPFTLEVRILRSPSRYKDQMVYRKSVYEVGFYEYSQWIEPPAEMVTRALLSALKQSQLFQRVDPTGAIFVPDLVLQGSIVDFDQVVSKKGNMADLEINLEIVSALVARPVWTYTAKAMVEQEKKGASGFVPAMAAAVDRAISAALKAMEDSEELRDLAVEKGKLVPTPAAAAQ